MDQVNEGFERIATQLLEMQRRMQLLVQENSRLQEQLAALRRGVGVQVVIEGRTLSLISASSPEQLRSPF